MERVGLGALNLGFITYWLCLFIRSFIHLLIHSLHNCPLTHTNAKHCAERWRQNGGQDRLGPRLRGPCILQEERDHKQAKKQENETQVIFCREKGRRAETVDMGKDALWMGG